MVYRYEHRLKQYRAKLVPILFLIFIFICTASTVTFSQIAIGWVGAPIINRKDTISETIQSNTEATGSAHNVAGDTKKDDHDVAIETSKTSLANDTSIVRSTDCNNNAPKHAIQGESPQLNAVSQYELLCGSGIIDSASFFVPTPINSAQAQDYAYDVSVRLRAFSASNIRPTVFIEPTNNGVILDLYSYKDGAYDTALDEYFAALKNLGINDRSMGLWVFFPEGNIPVWNNVEPSIYAANVTKTATYMKKYFPSSEAGLLLDSATYPSGESWSGSRYVSLVPYLKNIPKGLIQSFGLQGFPWAPPASERAATSFNPNTYLQINEAVEAANALGTNNIWLNTGTFSKSYANNAINTVTVTPSQRQSMLDGVVSQAVKLRKQGFNVSVHLFSEDKSKTAEAINWSYLDTSESKDVFRSFSHDTQSNKISLWLFDAR